MLCIFVKKAKTSLLSRKKSVNCINNHAYGNTAFGNQYLGVHRAN